MEQSEEVPSIGRMRMSTLQQEILPRNRIVLICQLMAPIAFAFEQEQAMVRKPPIGLTPFSSRFLPEPAAEAAVEEEAVAEKEKNKRKQP